MASTINASTSSGLVNTADTSGVLQLQTNSTTAVTIDTSQNFFVNKTTYSDTAGNGFGVFPNSGVPQVSCVGASNSTNKNFTVYSSTDSAYKFYVNYAGGGYFAGNVGIGTTSPAATLDVQTSAGRFQVLPSGGSSIALYNGTSGGNIAIDSSGGITLFKQNGTESMRIDSSGNVIMGNTAYDYSANGFGFGASNAYSYFTRTSGYALLVNLKTTTGAMQSFTYNQSGVGNVSTNGSNCTFNSTSDYRLKQNIQPMTGALAKVALLKPVTYNWIRENQAGEGFIAHELQEVVPEAVVGTKDAVDEVGNPVYQAIDQSVLVATLTAAIQELNAKVDAQAAEIQALKGVA